MTPVPDRRSGRWQQVFHTSKLTQYMWVVDKAWNERVWGAIEGAHIPQVRHSSMYGPRTESAALLDGLVVYLDHYGFASGMLPSGTRVIGPRVLRWLCHQLQLPPPRKLLIESGTPSHEELENDLHEQLAHVESLREKATIGLDIGDKETLLDAISQLFGEEVAPRRVPGPLEPAEGALGQQGFTREEAEALGAAGISDDEAKRWLDHGFSTSDTANLAGLDISQALAWRRYTYTAEETRAVIEAGVDLGTAQDLSRAGCPREAVACFCLRGMGVPDWEQWSAAGLDPERLRILIRANIPAIDAPRWARLPLNFTQLHSFLNAGRGSLDQAEAYNDAGLDPGEWYLWSRAGVGASECLRWQRVIRDPTEAIEVREAGYSPEDVARYNATGLRTAAAIIKRLSLNAP